MTRAETLAAITEMLESAAVTATHYPECELDHPLCAVAWLLQEIAYLNTKIETANALVDLVLETTR